jgi:DNA-binding NarL/FixJ family response regulator
MTYAVLVSLDDRRARRGERFVSEAVAHERIGPLSRTWVRAVVVDADPRIRDAVTAALEAEPGIAVVAAVAAIDGTLDLAHEVVVVGHRFPGTSAVEVCARLKREQHPPPVVVVAHAPRAALMRRVLQAGASGFVSSDCAPEVLREAVRYVTDGDFYVDPSLGRLVVEVVARADEPRPYGLTRAELDVVALLPRGLMNREIAIELGITENTVKTHLRHALRKLAVRDRAQAAALVVREGLA